MPSLTPEELQAARRASGRLGGRPPKPTRDEAREHALAHLVPKALHVLAAHLGEGDDVNPHAWRAALKVFEYAFGRPPEEAAETKPAPTDIASMSEEERAELRALVIAKLRAGGDDDTALTRAA